MIVLIAALTMAAPAAPTAPLQERRALGSCLSKFVHDKLADKMEGAAFKTAANKACAAQADAFRTAWVRYDVEMRTPRADAEQNAQSQIDDYLENSTASYVDGTTPQKPKGADPASPVKSASATTPPKR